MWLNSLYIGEEVGFIKRFYGEITPQSLLVTIEYCSSVNYGELIINLEVIQGIIASLSKIYGIPLHEILAFSQSYGLSAVILKGNTKIPVTVKPKTLDTEVEIETKEIPTVKLNEYIGKINSDFACHYRIKNKETISLRILGLNI